MKRLSVTLIALLLGTAAIAQKPGNNIDVQHYRFEIHLNDADNRIEGQATITVKFLKDADSFQMDLVKQSEKGKGMVVQSIGEQSAEVLQSTFPTKKGKNPGLRFHQDSDGVNVYTVAKAGSIHTYSLRYSGIPADGLIISTNKFGHRTFFGDNWPNRAHNWLPCVDDPADKASVDFIVQAPAHYAIIANGLKVSESRPDQQGNKTTHWQEKAQLSTKIMVIGVADFAIDHTGDVGKIPVYTYVFPENSAQGFHDYAVAKEILPFYIKHVGPFAYGKLANVQSKTIFGGMENAGAIFYFENSVGDKDIESLMAHEIAHQWFGDAASEKNWSNLWLSEGFATYMTNLYLENKYGPEILKTRMGDDRKKVINFEKRHFAPVVDTGVKHNFMQLLNANSYQKGGWALHMLRRKLGGDLFWKGIRAYFARYNGSNANTDDFRQIMEQASGQDLKVFFKQWLYTAGHPKLKTAWTFNEANHTLTLTVEQLQDNLYDAPLSFLIDGDQQLHRINISQKITTVVIPVAQKPTKLTFDPDVDLLADFVNGAGN